MKNAVDTFESGLDSGDLWMCTPSTNLKAPVDRWHTAIGPAELSVLERAQGPVIDVGCGPGRLVGWLEENGVPALGIDVSPLAVKLTKDKGASARLGDVFSLEFEHKFATVLLADGNIGIGGDPAALLSRVAELLRSDGVILCEVTDPESTSTVTEMILRSGDSVSEPFPWATLSAADISDTASSAGLFVESLWSVSDDADSNRWFAALRPAILAA